MLTMTAAQDGLVAAITATAPAGWRRIVIDLEYLAEDGGFTLDTVSFAIVGAGDDLSDPAFDLNREARHAAGALHDAMAATGNGWGGLQLTIQRSGSYRFVFDHGEPRRLNGKWDAERAAQLDNYLAACRAELNGISAA